MANAIDPTSKRTGDELLATADKLLKPKFLRSLSESDYDDAANVYNQAAIRYKLAKDWISAAKALVKKAQAHRGAGEKGMAISSLEEAAVLFQRVAAWGSLEACLKEAADTAVEDGKFDRAAKCLSQLGDYLVQEGSTTDDVLQLHKAIQSYHAAADFYHSAGGRDSARVSTLAKLGDLQMQLLKYAEAAETFKEASDAVQGDQRAVRFIGADCAFKAVVCLLANDDLVGAKRLGASGALDDTLGRRRKLMETIFEAIESRDSATFTTALAEFDRVCKLDSVLVTAFLDVKRLLVGTPSAS